jgi:hypothetical protein
MVNLIEKFLFLGFEIMQFDSELAVLGQVDRRRMVKGGERAVQRLDIAFGQAHHFPDVLQLVAQRGDLLEVERHDAGNWFFGSRARGLAGLPGLGLAVQLHLSG